MSTADTLYDAATCLVADYATAQYYSDGEIWKYWNGTEFTTDGDCGIYGSTPASPTPTPTSTVTPTNALTLYSVTVGRSSANEQGACDDFNNDGGETLKLTTDTLTEGCTVYESNGTTLVTNEYISNGVKGGSTNGSGVFSFGLLCGF